MGKTEDRLPDSRSNEPGPAGDASPKGPGPSVDGSPKNGKAGGKSKAENRKAKAMGEAEREALIREAHDQTAAILRLEVVKRLGYSGVAIGVLLSYWGLHGGPGWSVPVGIVLLVVSAFVSIILYVGVRNAKQNVQNILLAAGVDPSMPKKEKKPKKKGKSSGKGASESGRIEAGRRRKK